MVTFVVVYQQDPQIMYQKFLNFIHMNIVLETELLIQVIPMVNTARAVKQELIPSPIIDEMKQFY